MSRRGPVIPLTILCALVFSSDLAASGVTVSANSCSRSDVSSALNAAAAGDVVAVPAGTCVWTSPLAMPQKNLTLRGAGIGSTVIIDETTCANCNLLTWAVMDDGQISRITGFTFQGGSDASGGMVGTKGNKGMLVFGGDTSRFVFDHNRVVATNTAGMIFYGYIRGVVGLNEFLLKNFQIGIYIHHTSWGNVGNFGDNSWAQPTTIGTADTFFLEGNTVVADQPTFPYASSFVDGENGMRFVARYNTLTHSYISNHGLETSGRLRSGRQFEVYNNTMTFSSAYSNDGVAMRGGTGVIFNNSITGPNIHPGAGYKVNTIRNSDPRLFFIWGWCGQRSASIARSGSTATVTVPSGHGLHPAANGTVLHYLKISGANQAEYNGTFAVTYLSETQYSYTVSGSPATPATGTIAQTNPWDQNVETRGYRCLDQIGAGRGDYIGGDYPGPASWPNQQLEPAYGWGNTLNGVAVGLSTSTPEIVVANRDYYNAVKPGYSPYTYPHPLLNGKSGPAPPTNLRIVPQ